MVTKMGSGSGYMTDDIDSLEISSDECLSPPIPPVRQRRNAIFERRDPPPPVINENDDDRFYQDEFEVASVSDINENPIEDANSTSAADDDERPPSPPTSTSLKRPLDLDDNSDGLDNNFADNETLRSEGESDETHVSAQGLSTDSEISEKDKWFCSQCHAKSMPYFRYCLRCFKIRRNWLPKRPRSRRLKRRKLQSQSSQSQSQRSIASSVSTATSTQFSTSSSQPQSTSSSQSQSTSYSQSQSTSYSQSQSTSFSPSESTSFSPPEATNFTPPEATSFSPPESASFSPPEGTSFSPPESTSFSPPEGTSFSPPEATSFSPPESTSFSQPQSQSQPKYPQSSTDDTDFLKPSKKEKEINLQSLCKICYAREKDAAFVHNKIAHHYCCYSCADKILKKDGKCPICRKRVLRVVKIISA